MPKTKLLSTSIAMSLFLAAGVAHAGTNRSGANLPSTTVKITATTAGPKGGFPSNRGLIQAYTHSDDRSAHHRDGHDNGHHYGDDNGHGNDDDHGHGHDHDDSPGS